MLFTASTSRYANAIIDRIDPQCFISYRLYRNHCTVADRGFVKDLSLLNRNLKDVVIVDNTALSYAFHPENALPIDTWINDKNDKQLYNLLPILKHLAKVKDVRIYLREIKKCKDHKSILKVLRSKAKDEVLNSIKAPVTELKQKNNTFSPQEALKASLEVAVSRSAALKTEIERLKSKMNVIESAFINNKAADKVNSKQMKVSKEKNKALKKKHKNIQELSAEKSSKPKHVEQSSNINNMQKSREDLLAQLDYFKSRLGCSDFNDFLKINPIFQYKQEANETNKRPENKVKSTTQLFDYYDYKEEKQSITNNNDYSNEIYEKRPKTTPLEVPGKYEVYDWLAERKNNMKEFSNPRRMPYKYDIESSIGVVKRLDDTYSKRVNKKLCYL